MILCLSAMAK